MRCAFGIWPKPSARPGLAFIGRELPPFTSGLRRVGVAVAAQFEPGDLVAVHLVRAIGKTQQPGRGERRGQKMVVAGAAAAEQPGSPSR